MPLLSVKREPLRRRLENLDWRVWLGLILTFVWLVLGYLYVEVSVGWDQFRHLSADQVGNFLQGAFAPLAFLWLAIGAFANAEGVVTNEEKARVRNREAVPGDRTARVRRPVANRHSHSVLSDST